jgi:hypothetical protein
MSTADLRKSAEKVTRIPDEAIRKVVGAHDLPEEVATKLIARKQDIAKRFELQAADETNFPESKHPRTRTGGSLRRATRMRAAARRCRSSRPDRACRSPAAQGRHHEG